MYTKRLMRANALPFGRNEQVFTKVRETVPEEPERQIPVPTKEEIRNRAFRIWEFAGKPDGDGVQFWLEAEQDLVNNKN
jgi:hypothetical protein